MAGPKLVRPEDFKDSTQTPGIVRKKALASKRIWAGVATTDSGVVSGWHHHGDHTTYLYVASGRFRLESGPAGRNVLEGFPGDFVKIPPRMVHRESNPSSEEARLIVFRIGGGRVVVNVKGPDEG